MSYLTVGVENGADIEIYYEDHGSGQPVVLVHGYPLDGHSWERQERALLAAGYRVITYDRRAYFGDFFDNFYNTDTFAPDRISDRALAASFQVAVGASPYASYACVDTWLTDFRADLPKIDVPTLVIHGTADRILPFDATAKRLPGLIKDLRFVSVEGGPHNICWTHYDEVNSTLLEFLAA
jgi:pimeloyl-ACP methyl ester carboxylesterase